ncbi:hypothetical protein DACRYDRAFT_22468 [Dacryopinax primogenitus]|uniref:Uncharacterized protein n=1 Tax=Dacryopinax primogenitus (strain DJM 731) TaxID=1858805 RepID=M5G608_DACPD|nr:uncharacterized protein DACRYDRAFT_22468 [Dacryopinax primogenitus]EJU01247.1 hypothetical protein DACRYDRAFT_22468 [Dacryopinax primogenitus]
MPEDLQPRAKAQFLELGCRVLTGGRLSRDAAAYEWRGGCLTGEGRSASVQYGKPHEGSYRTYSVSQDPRSSKRSNRPTDPYASSPVYTC